MTNYGLCIGINDYPGTNSDLAGCVNDANDWATMLQSRGFKVDRLLDRESTGERIRNAIAETIRSATAGESVVIQYSGHGSFVPDEDNDEPDGTDECICPHDISTKGPITDDELFELYSSRDRGVRLLIISDSCHSGTVARFAPITTPPTMAVRNPPQRKVRFLPPASFLPEAEASFLGTRAARSMSPPGRYAGILMAGCQDTEFSWDAYFEGRPNGAFTFVALRALNALGPTATLTEQSATRASRQASPLWKSNQAPKVRRQLFSRQKQAHRSRQVCLFRKADKT